MWHRDAVREHPRLTMHTTTTMHTCFAVTMPRGTDQATMKVVSLVGLSRSIEHYEARRG